MSFYVILNTHLVEESTLIYSVKLKYFILSGVAPGFMEKRLLEELTTMNHSFPFHSVQPLFLISHLL